MLFWLSMRIDLTVMVYGGQILPQKRPVNAWYLRIGQFYESEVINCHRIKMKNITGQIFKTNGLHSVTKLSLLPKHVQWLKK